MIKWDMSTIAARICDCERKGFDTSGNRYTELRSRTYRAELPNGRQGTGDSPGRALDAARHAS